MKKIFIIIGILLSFVIFSSCESLEEKEDIDINLKDLEGLGNLYQPYEIQLFEGEEKVVEVNISDETKNFEFQLGNRYGEEFKRLELFEVKSFKITNATDVNGFKLIAVEEGEAYVKISVEENSIYLKVRVEKLPKVPGKSIKILAIGNSFSENAMTHLYEILINTGYEDVVLGNLYISGATLEAHMLRLKLNQAVPKYAKKNSGRWENKTGFTIIDGIKDEDWDIITLQQGSGFSGISESYDPYLEQLIDVVNKNKTNDNAKLAWHMTWAYQQNSNHTHFPIYNNDQMTMYNAIINTTDEKIVTNPAFDMIIPAGTAIQNLRTSSVGDTVTADGYHLSTSIGCYTVGLLWFAMMSGEDVSTVNYYPSTVNANLIDTIKESVSNSIVKPFEITNSIYKN